jgi:hypothetical protein
MAGPRHAVRLLDVRSVGELARRAVPTTSAGGLTATAVLVAEARWWALLVLVPTALMCIAADLLDLK